VLDFAARRLEQTARLEIYGEHEHRHDAHGSHGRGARGRHEGEDRPHPAKPRPRPARPKPRSSQT
jgi:hypothetical protein